MKLSIVIVNYNVKYFLEQCLNSVLGSNIAFDYEVYVVDNHSTDGSINYLSSKFTQPHLHFIANNSNPGFAKANNQAIRLCQGEYILLLNPDTVVGENTLANVCNFMDTTPDCGAIGVKMIDGSGRFLPESKRGFPSPWASFCKIVGLDRLFPTSVWLGGYNLRYLDENKIHQVPVLAGAFILIRSEALNQAGLLDEAFFMYGEDIDLSYRIQLAGYTNYYLPEAIIHYKGESTDKNSTRYLTAFYGAMHIFYKKYYPRNRLFSAFLLMGIKIRIGLDSVIRLLKKVDKKKHQEGGVVVTFNKNEISYQDMIREMDKNLQTNVSYRIYHPETGLTIGTQFTQL